MPPVRTSSPSSRRAILTIAISAIALETALLGMVAPLLPEIESRTGAGDEALGLALAAYAIPILFISLPVGRLADRLGRRPLLLGGLVLTGLGSILIATSGALAPLLVGGPDSTMFGNTIQSFFQETPNWNYGAVLAMWLIAVVLVLVLLFGRFLSTDLRESKATA